MIISQGSLKKIIGLKMEVLHLKLEIEDLAEENQRLKSEYEI